MGYPLEMTSCACDNILFTTFFKKDHEHISHESRIDDIRASEIWMWRMGKMHT